MKLFLKILSWGGMLLCVFLATALLGIRIFGITPYAVISGSMEPTYMTGSLVFVKAISPQNIKNGDNISFTTGDDLKVVTHRVIQISNDGQYFYTKGDANKIADQSPVYYKNIIGRVSFSIPILGYFLIWITSFYGKIFCFSLICGCIIYAFVRSLLKYKNPKKTEN